MTLSFIDNSDVPLVLIGGTLCNARLWHPLIERLNVAAVFSVTLAGDDSAMASSQRLLKMLPPRFLLVGFSLGGIVALQIAADAPERLAGLALLSVNPLADSPNNAPNRRAAVRAARKQGHGEWLSSTLWQKYVAPTNLSNQQLHDVIAEMAQETDNETFARQSEIAISRRDNRESLAALSCPVLVLNGEYDPICTPEHHRLITQSVAHATWFTLSSTGHFFVLEAVEKTAGLLRTWIMESLNANK